MSTWSLASGVQVCPFLVSFVRQAFLAVTGHRVDAIKGVSCAVSASHVSMTHDGIECGRVIESDAIQGAPSFADGADATLVVYHP